jgi:hypothetical protein
MRRDLQVVERIRHRERQVMGKAQAPQLEAVRQLASSTNVA